MTQQVKRQSLGHPSDVLEALRQAANRTIADVLLSSPGLRIDGGAGSPTAEAQNATYLVVGETILLIAAGTNMPALVGTVVNTEFGLFVWTVNSAGTVTQTTLATGASLAAITLPSLPDDEAVLGALIVNPTGTGDFVGGTTNLDDATVVPNAVFLNGSNFGAAINPVDRITFI